MYWLTENAFQPMIIGILVAFAAWTFWYISGKRGLLIAAIAALIVTAGIVITEQLIVTDSEQLRKDLFLAGAAVQLNDVDEVLRYISPTAENLIDEAKREMADITFKKLTFRRLSEPDIDLEATPPTASLSFNAIVTVDCSQSSRYGNMPRANGAVRGTLFFIKDSEGDWKIVDYNYKPLTTKDLMGTKAP